MWNLKRNDTNELTYKTNKRLSENKLKVSQGEGCGEGKVREFGMCTHHIIYSE